ncbi:UDP-Glycosyltransferase superfamily protein [Striga hermonthica]|uniref:UDP-Glycosyltransferase superfamily protein n=1 Tax=Striga hermonthica TaxID=68872 RepID=A0A9N7NXR7_STRHE|nr:UDP-Glycosyltransferase superfamily protein [Striga hermonthica]
MASEATRKNPIAVFMAFGTKGDVYPISAIAAAFASARKQYEVAFVTHSAHEDLRGHLGIKGVQYFPIFSPPTLSSVQENNNTGGSTEGSFSMQKHEITRKHRKECLLVVESIYGETPTIDGDLIIINFFALEGWSLAELFDIRCVVAAPYVVPYSAPSSFERQFRNELPLLYKYLQQAPIGKIGWEDVTHWMWPLFSEDWGTWRSHELQLSFWPFTDPVTGLPTWHVRPPSPILLYGFSQEVVECPGYWPSAVRVCGFWFPPVEWQFSCSKCAEISLRKLNAENELCSMHAKLDKFLDSSAERPIFISLSSIGSMGYMRNPQAFLRVIEKVSSITKHRFILLSAGYGPLDAAIQLFAQTPSSNTERIESTEVQTCLFDDRLFCFSGAVPYSWLFPRCCAAIHHGGSGSTAVALRAGIPQVICPFILDQFYWAERMCWLGVAPDPLDRSCLVPDEDDDTCISKAANVIVSAINYALSTEVRSRATQIADRISTEDGVSTALRVIEKEILCSD